MNAVRTVKQTTSGSLSAHASAARAWASGYAKGRARGAVTDCPWHGSEKAEDAALRHWWMRGFAHAAGVLRG